MNAVYLPKTSDFDSDYLPRKRASVYEPRKDLIGLRVTTRHLQSPSPFSFSLLQTGGLGEGGD